VPELGATVAEAARDITSLIGGRSQAERSV
jgi:hypothetical protein